MAIFEYLKIAIVGEEQLRDLGYDGWELIVADHGEYIFKRQKTKWGRVKDLPNTDWYKPDYIKGR